MSDVILFYWTKNNVIPWFIVRISQEDLRKKNITLQDLRDHHTKKETDIKRREIIHKLHIFNEKQELNGAPFIILSRNEFERQKKDCIVFEKNIDGKQCLISTEIFTKVPPQIPPDIPEELLCKVCMENKINTTIIPCGHACVCIEDSKKLKECPMCRGEIKEIIKLFF